MMNKFQLYYYKTISSLIPNIMLVLIIWTCYDMFLSSILMMMIFYMLMTLYYFQVEDPNLRTALTLKVEEFVYFEKKREFIFTGYFYTTIICLPCLFVLLNFTTLPIYLPIPNNPQNVFLVVYFSFILLLFAFGLQIMSELFYKVFVNHIANEYIQILLESILEIEMLYFFTDEPAYIILFAVFCVIKNYQAAKCSFAESCYFKMGMAFGFIVFMILLIGISRKYPIVEPHPKNYWKF